MAHQDNCTLQNEFLEKLTEQGLEGLQDMIRIIINEAMRNERQAYLGASPYERTPERRGRANRYKAKKVKTRVGEINFEVPQVREGGSDHETALWHCCIFHAGKPSWRL